jgi:hypothetical protein
MRGAKASAVVRRSFALPRDVVEEAQQVAAPELKDNLNRLVVVALKKYIELKKRETFERSMAEMAADPGIRYAITEVQEGLSHTETDGLGAENDKTR